MADDSVLRYAGKPDINDQFKAGPKIRKTRRLYDRIKDGNGDYRFGELTAFFYKFDEDDDDIWQSDIKNKYPKWVRDQIKQTVIQVLSQVDPHDTNPQVSLEFEWSSGGPVGVATSYDQANHAYKIKISGLPGPYALSLAERHATKSD